MKLLWIILTLPMAMFYIANTAVPINQMVINRVYCNNSMSLFDCHVRVQKKNKTAQMITGNVTLKTPSTNDIMATATFSYQDFSGVWKGVMLKNMTNICDMYFGKDSMFADQRAKYTPDVKLGCPAQPQFSSVGPAYVMRHRKDWEKDLQLMIPPYWIEADNWALVGKFFHKDDPETIIGEVTAEVRLFNEQMSQ